MMTSKIHGDPTSDEIFWLFCSCIFQAPRESLRTSKYFQKLINRFCSTNCTEKCKSQTFDLALVCVAAARLSLSHIRVALSHMRSIDGYTHVFSSVAHTYHGGGWARASSGTAHIRMHLEKFIFTHHDDVAQHKTFCFRTELNEMRNAKHQTVLVRTRTEFAHWAQGISRELTSKTFNSKEIKFTVKGRIKLWWKKPARSPARFFFSVLYENFTFWCIPTIPILKEQKRRKSLHRKVVRWIGEFANS